MLVCINNLCANIILLKPFTMCPLIMDYLGFYVQYCRNGIFYLFLHIQLVSVMVFTIVMVYE